MTGLLPTDPAAYSAASDPKEASANAFYHLAQILERAGLAEPARRGFEVAAEIDLTNARLQNSWGGPFNGQKGRQALFLRLLERLQPAAVVETGTYRGNTTEWMAENFKGPILSCEIDYRYYLQSQRRLIRYPHVRVDHQDSRIFLSEVIPTLPMDRPVIFYLDAHWNDDLPLAAEIRKITAATSSAIIMIDDFCVPFDPGYSYDDFGPGKRLSIEILHWMKDGPWGLFFPALPSWEETGERRGAVLLATGSVAKRLATLDELRAFDWRQIEVAERGAKLTASSELPTVEKREAETLVSIQSREITKLRAALAASERRRTQTLEVVASKDIEVAEAVSEGKLRAEIIGKALAEERQRTEALTRAVEEATRRAEAVEKALVEKVKKFRTDKLRIEILARGLIVERLVTGNEDVVQLRQSELEALLRDRERMRLLCRSRWRRVGQMVGVAGRLDWEESVLQSSPIEVGHQRLAPLSEAAVALASESAGADDKSGAAIDETFAPPDLPVLASPLSELPISVDPPSISAEMGAHALGFADPDDGLTFEEIYARQVEKCSRQFIAECRNFGVDVVLDVGSNTGQFGHDLRRSGYFAEIVSFEPLWEAHAKLVTAAADDPLWHVAERCAVGAASGVSVINVAQNSYSSSILPMLEDHVAAAPESIYVTAENCKIITLDDYLPREFPDPKVTFALKIDAQGYEQQVLNGALKELDRVQVILTEISLVPLYEGAPSITDLIGFLRTKEFACIALLPEFTNRLSREMLQVNGLFVKTN